MDCVKQIITGVWETDFCIRSGSQEKIAQKGRHYGYISLMQMFQASTAVSLAGRIVPIPSYVINIAMAAPFVLSQFATAHPAVLKTHQHLGDLCQLVSFVSAIALVILGEGFFGMSCAAVLVLGYLDQTHHVPRPLLQNVRNLTFVTTQAARFLFGCTWSRVAMVVDIFFMVGDRYVFAEREKAAQEAVSLLTLPDVAQLDEDDLVIDERHIHAPIYEVPDTVEGVDLNVLKTLAKDAPFDLAVVQAQLETDDNWNLKPEPGKEIDYIRAGIDKFIVMAQLDNKSELCDYAELKKLASHLADLLPEVSPEDQAAYLTVLGCAGHYCDVEHFKTANEIYKNIQDVGLKKRILRILAEKRGVLFAKAVQAVPQMPFLSSMTKFGDIHNENWWINNLGVEIGHPDLIVARQDPIAEPSPTLRKLIVWANYYIIKWVWDEYDPIDVITRAIDDGTLKEDYFHDWMKKKVEISGSLNVADYANVKNDKYILALLIESGVLRGR